MCSNRLQIWMLKGLVLHTIYEEKVKLITDKRHIGQKTR